jgi:histidine decarboxylase
MFSYYCSHMFAKKQSADRLATVKPLPKLSTTTPFNKPSLFPFKANSQTVSLASSQGELDLKPLGINDNSLASMMMNNVGSPWTKSETWQMEVKDFEQAIFSIMSTYFQQPDLAGYVTSGGTEANQAGIWWAKRRLLFAVEDQLAFTLKLNQHLQNEIQRVRAKLPEDLHYLTALQKKLLDNIDLCHDLSHPALFYTKSHTHYSIDKISNLFHLAPVEVRADAKGAIDIADFAHQVKHFLAEHPRSAIIVNANIGTTLTGASDNVPALKNILQQYAPNQHAIHMDGALTGLLLPILKLHGNTPNYLSALGADSIAISGHKFLGIPQACGIIMTPKDFLNKAFKENTKIIEYVGNIHDITISGSRSGLLVLMFYKALKDLRIDSTQVLLQKQFLNCLTQARYLYQELCKLYGRNWVQYPNHFHILFPKPSAKLIRDYQLMVSGTQAIICVLGNVNKALSQLFLSELTNELVNLPIGESHDTQSRPAFR